MLPYLKRFAGASAGCGPALFLSLGQVVIFYIVVASCLEGIIFRANRIFSIPYHNMII